MVRSRFILFLAMLVVVTYSKGYEEQEEETRTTTEEEDTEATEEREEETTTYQPKATTTAPRLTRTTSSKPLRCFVCSYKRDSYNRNCLDPLRHNVTSTDCSSPGDKCFTAVDTRESGLSIAVRGCKSACISSPDIICCGTDLCNSQPVGQPHRTVAAPYNSAYKSLPQTVLYFVTVLLLLQAVVKVNIV